MDDCQPFVFLCFSLRLRRRGKQCCSLSTRFLCRFLLGDKQEPLRSERQLRCDTLCCVVLCCVVLCCVVLFCGCVVVVVVVLSYLCCRWTPSFIPVDVEQISRSRWRPEVRQRTVGQSAVEMLGRASPQRRKFHHMLRCAVLGDSLSLWSTASTLRQASTSLRNVFCAADEKATPRTGCLSKR